MWVGPPASSSTPTLGGHQPLEGEAACSSGHQRGDQAPIHPSIIPPVFHHPFNFPSSLQFSSVPLIFRDINASAVFDCWKLKLECLMLTYIIIWQKIIHIYTLMMEVKVRGFVPNIKYCLLDPINHSLRCVCAYL